MIAIMEEIDRTILEHLARYRVSVRAVLSRLNDANKVLKPALERLLGSDLVVADRSLPGNRALYQLSKKGASVLEISESRARRFGSQAMHKHLGVLLFCHVAGCKRYRLEDDELRELVGDPLPEGTHCMAQIDDQPVLLGVYIPGAETSVRSIVRRVRELVVDARRVSGLRDMIMADRFGIALVVTTSQRRKVVSKALNRPEADGRPALARQVRIIVEWLPAFDLLINGVPLDQPSKQPDRPTSKSRRKRSGSRPPSTPNLFETDAPESGETVL